MKFIKIHDYLIKADLISGVSDVKKIEKKDEKGEIKSFFLISLFFDGNMIDWYFDNEEEANKLENFIKAKILELS